MISIKKVGIVVAAAGLLVASAVPAFASEGGRGSHRGNSIEVEQTNDSRVENEVTVSSNTGDNGSGRHHSRGGRVTTGNAATEADVLTVANTNVADVDACGCSGRRGSSIEVEQSNEGDVENEVTVSSNTGDNSGRRVRTGTSFTSAGVGTVANSNVALVN